MEIIRGSGTIITESRTVSDFDSVELIGSGDLIITQDESESLTVETDDNIMQYVNTEVRDGTLYLSVEGGGKSISHTELVFVLTVKDLTGMMVTGSGDVVVDSLNSDHLDVDVTGSGKVTIGTLTTEAFGAEITGSGMVNVTGETISQDVTVDGSGKYLAGDLYSTTAVINTSGSGEATIWTTESLEADISGSGTVDYYGNPTVTSDITGSGEINNLGEK